MPVPNDCLLCRSAAENEQTCHMDANLEPSVLKSPQLDLPKSLQLDWLPQELEAT